MHRVYTIPNPQNLTPNPYFLTYFPVRMRRQFTPQIRRKINLVSVSYTGSEEVNPGLYPKRHNLLSGFENACSQRVHLDIPENGVRRRKYLTYCKPQRAEI